MAFDFNNEVNPAPKQPLDDETVSKDLTMAVARHYQTDCFPIGDNTGREYLKSIGYFNAAEKFYMVDPKLYLDLFPATRKNFGVSIWELGSDNPTTCTWIDEAELGRPQLVFQQVYCENDGNEVRETQSRKQLLHYFRGIYKVTKGSDGNYRWEKLWNVFIFDPSKEYKYQNC